MECGGAYDCVENALKRQTKQIAREQVQPASELLREMSARSAQHVLRQVDADDTPKGQGFQQFGSEQSGTATGIEDPFFSPEFQAGEDFLAPTHLGR